MNTRRTQPSKENDYAKRTMCFSFILVLAVTLIYTLPAAGYEFYNGSNNCVQCHPGFVGGFGASLHDTHTEFISSCTTCHVSSGDNPLIEKCATYHIPNPLWNTHRTGPVDLEGFTCATCHSFVGNDERTWGETKSYFR